MSTTAETLPRNGIDARLIALAQSGAIMMGVFLSGFVINEPAPYELYMVGLIAVWAIFGLRISRAVTPLAILLVVFNIGGLLALSQMSDLRDAPLYIAVSLFLAFTSIFIAAVIEAQPTLYRVIFIGWLASALIGALLASAGYFSAFPGAEVFTRYGRATGPFQDPNVFGPFLVLPAVWLLHRLLTRPAKEFPFAAAMLLVLVIGLFLSFSRGAWGLFGASAAMLVGALFLQSSSGRFRLRLALMTSLALVAMALAILVVLQIPAVAELFTSRAQLVQEYDGARLGRFARYGLGFMMATEHPLGIGPLVFGRIFGEDTHNIWLKALMDYGWLGFAAWLVMVVWTVGAGFRILFRDRPWQPYLLCAWVVLLGHVALGTFIDTDHWRHFYLLLGLVWGAIALEQRHHWMRRRQEGVSRPANPGTWTPQSAPAARGA